MKHVIQNILAPLLAAACVLALALATPLRAAVLPQPEAPGRIVDAAVSDARGASTSRPPRFFRQFFDASAGVGAGSAADVGSILRTTDGGRSWRGVGSLAGACVDGLIDAVTALRFATPDQGWAAVRCIQGATTPATLYQTSDGGASWQPAEWQGDEGSAAETLDWTSAMATKRYGWRLAGGELLATDNGGRSWVALRLAKRAWQFSLIEAGVGWALGSDCDECALKLFFTADGGANWTEFRPRGLRIARGAPSVQFVDRDHGWITANDGALYATRDGGRSWELASR